ncbi:MAG TPA: dockerin type I domain-containing protein [Fimbriimonadaceae bacterium]|nr:dockerin type I domain-containing protein [Fimbriimonadaceae bacterium]HRJ97285.1 dockerin type I domain-containing protein [Fimbriimonadaceae bacterium]
MRLIDALKSLRVLPVLAVALGVAGSAEAVQLSTRKQLNRILLSNGRCDDFEKVTFTGNQHGVGLLLNEFTSGGSPAQTGLVQPMVEYRPGPPLAGAVTFLNAGHGGGPTKRLWASNSAGMTITYRVPVRAFGMDFYAFPGFGGNLNARITLADGTIVNVPFTFTGAQTPYFFGFGDARCIKEVRFQDLNGQGAVNIDNHCFGCPPGRGWCEPFPDWAYAFNTSPHQNATRGWYLAEGFPNEAGLIQDLYCSPSRGLFLHTTTDLMRDFKCISNGKYVFSGMWWVPSNSDPVQRSYFMLMNNPHTQPFAFSMQVGANATNVVFVPVGIQGTETGDFISAPITTKTNQWVNVCAFIDLTNDRQEVYYDGTLIAKVRWRPNITQSLLQIHTINVYGGDLGGTSWVDDLAVVPDCPRTYQVGFKDAWAWGGDYTPVSPQLLPWLPATPIKFDKFPFDQFFGASFMNLPSGPCKNFKGTFFSPMRANPTAGAIANADQLRLGLTPSNTWAYTAGLGALTGTTWGTAGLQNIDVKLDANVLMAINDTGRLDFRTNWFTGADYARLKLWNCNPCWRGYWWDTIGPIDLDFNAAGNLLVDFQGGPGTVLGDLGSSSGGQFVFAEGPAIDDLTNLLALTALGRINGQAGQQIARLNIAGGMSAAAISGDFSSISPSQVRVLLYNQAGALLLDQARPPNSLLSFTSPANTVITAWCENSRPDKEEFFLHVEPTSVVVGGTNVNNVATVVVSARNPAVNVENVSHLELYGQGNPTIELSNFRGYLPGNLAISALGGSVLSSVEGGIIVNSLVDAESDGLLIDLPNSTGFRFALDEPQWIRGWCPNRFQAFGTLNGTPNSPVGTLRIEKASGDWEVTADYSSVSSPTTRVIVYRQGQVLTDQTGLPPHAVSLLEMPLICEKGRQPPCFVLEMAAIQPIKVSGTPFLGDRVAILAEPTVPITVSGYSAVEISAGEAEEMFVRNPMALRPLSGTVTLGEFEPDEAGRLVFMEFRYPGSEEILDTEWVVLGAGGSFSTVVGLYGQVEVLVKGSHWLRKLTTIQVGDSGASGLAVTLVNGDSDGDNEVSIGDFAMISASFNKCEGDPGFQPNADLNGDGCVDIGDFAIMSSNFGDIGD